VQEKTRHEIHIERGMTAGQRIVLTGAGDQEVSAPSVTNSSYSHSNSAWSSPWRCYLCPKNSTTRIVRTFRE
jgi:hypothetical protein